MTMKITDDELNYWKEREHAYQTSQIASDEATAKRMAANLKKAKENIQAQINEFYGRYAKSEGLTIEEAQKAVSKMDVKAFENKAKEYVANKDFSQRANEQLKLYNATMRINRLELLKAQINLELSQATSANEAIILDSLERQRVAELRRQAGILGESLGDLQRGLESQTNGDYQLASFSENLWQNHAEMMSELGNQLRRAVMMGENPAAHASAFQRAFEKAFNKNNFNAKRLLVTETARVQADMQLSAYQTSGYDEYVYIAEPSACKHCAALDGEVFKVSEMTVGRNMFPMHPFCKCSTAPHMSRKVVKTEEKEFKKTDSSNYNQDTTDSQSSGAISARRGNIKKQQDAFAERYYNQLRNSKRDSVIDKISASSGVDKETVGNALSHILDNTYQLWDSEAFEYRERNFYPHYDMAQSFQRLMLGNPKESDIIMLKHESLEAFYMSEYKMAYDDAHKLANEKYNYQEADKNG